MSTLTDCSSELPENNPDCIPVPPSKFDLLREKVGAAILTEIMLFEKESGFKIDSIEIARNRSLSGQEVINLGFSGFYQH